MNITVVRFLFLFVSLLVNHQRIAHIDKLNEKTGRVQLTTSMSVIGANGEDATAAGAGAGNIYISISMNSIYVVFDRFNSQTLDYEQVVRCCCDVVRSAAMVRSKLVVAVRYVKSSSLFSIYSISFLILILFACFKNV